MEIKSITQVLFKKKLTIAVAESCTGGLLASSLTDIPGSSKYFILGVVAYANDAKIHILGIAPEIITKHGAVSQETAIAMAQNIKHLGKTNIGIGITGIAGPTGGNALKPVGTVFIAVGIGHHIYFKKFQFKGDRLKIKKAAAAAALEMLKECLN